MNKSDLHATILQATIDAYWSRPFKAHVYTDSFSGTFMFDTENAAVKYVTDQATRCIRYRGLSPYPTFRATVTGMNVNRIWHHWDII